MNVLTRRLLTVALLAGLSFGGRAQAQNQPAVAEPKNIGELVAAVRKEGGNLNIAWASAMNGGAAGIKRFGDDIEAKYHIRLNIQYTPLAIPGGAFENQIMQEVKANQPSSSDVLFNVHLATEAPYFQSVDFRRYDPELPANFAYFQDRAFPVTTIFEGFTYNSKLIPADKAPKSLADLLKPEWKGKIATPPYEGIEGAYVGLPQVLGKDGMTRFYTAFSKQLGAVMRCGSDDRIVSGEVPIFGIDCGDYAARIAQRSGQPLASVYPKEGAGLLFFAQGIPKTAAHPYAARLLIAYLLSKEGQRALWDVMGTDNYRLPGSHMGAVVADAKKRGVKVVEVFGLDIAHPELLDYEQTIDALVNKSQ